MHDSLLSLQFSFQSRDVLDPAADQKGAEAMCGVDVGVERREDGLSVVVGRFCNSLVSAVRLMVVDHDNGPDNMAASEACFKIRYERSHRRLQSLGPVPVAAVL